MFHFKKKTPKFLCPANGTILELSNVPDPVFAQKMMGDGFAIELSDGKVVSPMDGEIVTAFPTGHAYGIRNQEGVEVLVHIGLDTVELQGEGFQSNVNVGDQIKQGDCLVNVDIEFIKQKEKSLISPIIFTSGETIRCTSPNSQVTRLDDVIQIK